MVLIIGAPKKVPLILAYNPLDNPPFKEVGRQVISIIAGRWFGGSWQRRQLNPIMENQMKKKAENEMESLGPFKGVYRDMPQ